MNNENFFDLEPLRMEAYRFLSDCYLLPEGGLGEKLERMHHAMEIVCTQATPCVKDMMDGMESPEILMVEYAGLFIGPYEVPAPPYGSVYLEGSRRIMGNSTMHALQMYEEAGLKLADHFRDAPDHIAAELEFLYFLIYKEIEKMLRSEAEGALFYLIKRKSFLENHLVKWALDFIMDMEKNAQTSFYKNLARTTGEFLRSDLDALDRLTLPGDRSGN